MTERVVHAEAGPAWSAAWSRTVTDLVNEACRGAPDRPAMIFEDGLAVTRGELLQRSEQFAGFLAGRVAPGERVAIMVENRTEYMVAWLAALAARAVMVPINPGGREHDAGHVLRDSGSVLLIAGEEQRPVVEIVRPSCPELREVIWIEGPEPDGLAPHCAGVTPLAFRDSRAAREDITNVYYTSGTTGAPKGCMIDHEYWLRAVDVDIRLHPKGPDDRILCCLQFYYLDPSLLLLIALQTGGALVVMRRFSVSRFWDVVRGNDVTEILGIASIPIYLLKAPPGPDDRNHKVKRALQVAVPPSLHREMNERWGFPWIDGYGITEGGYVSRVPLSHAEEMTGSGSMGVPCPEVSVRIVDDRGRTLPPGEVGEVLVRAPGLMRGYLNLPQATAETLRDGWLHTGDLARQDERGFMYFAGRKRDLIRRSGQNLSAAEVEEVLRSHPKVLEAAVIPVPDLERGEEVKAYVQLVDGETPATVPGEDLVSFCATKLVRYKVPRYIEYRTEFPRTPSMRVKKEDLKAEREDLTEGCWDREKVGTP
jgi:crotonobetaine/carnitine-CoA ligase